ncbi:unnamed protein product [Cylicocyclus nassatus]|uniref:Uncharacterized protein n=1 Tax=Cylicocyclus nassatus TaxID=53992 RepID=A0AA36H427_CYLNA|nr:unnamed protein product [Cylicocyclus nassatus]
MWTKAVIFLITISSIHGSVMIQQAKIGETVKLELGSDVVTWKRVRKGDVEEFIKYCGPTEKGPRCAQFVNAANKPVPPATKAHVEKDGTLIIESFKATDAGLYSSSDQKPFVKILPRGSQISTLRPHIKLVVQN